MVFQSLPSFLPSMDQCSALHVSHCTTGSRNTRYRPVIEALYEFIGSIRAHPDDDVYRDSTVERWWTSVTMMDHHWWWTSTPITVYMLKGYYGTFHDDTAIL